MIALHFPAGHPALFPRFAGMESSGLFLCPCCAGMGSSRSFSWPRSVALRSRHLFSSSRLVEMVSSFLTPCLRPAGSRSEQQGRWTASLGLR